MSDNTKFVNAYIENSIATIHEQIALVLQLKAQAKVSNDIIIERDERIVALEQEVERLRSELNSNRTNLSSYTEQINNSQANARKWEEEVNQLRGQLEHINTFVNQINEMKQMLRDKDSEIEKLTKRCETKDSEIKALKTKPDLKNSKSLSTKDINKKDVKVETDDF